MKTSTKKVKVQKKEVKTPTCDTCKGTGRGVSPTPSTVLPCEVCLGTGLNK